MTPSSPAKLPASRRWLVLPGGILLAEIGLMLLAAQTDHTSLTPLSVIVAGGVLVAGWLPVILRPGLDTGLAAAFVTVLAGVLYGLPPDAQQIAQALPHGSMSGLPAFWLVRLLNGGLLIPLGVHLTAYFPRRNALSARTLFLIYLATIGLLMVVMLVPFGSGLRWPWGAFLAWQLSLLAFALLQLVRTIRRSALDLPRAAAQARILLFVIVLSQTPFVIRLIGLPFELTLVPYDVVLVAEMILPLGIAYAILRHDLFGIDAAVRRALAYGTLSLSVLAIYLGFTVALTAILMRSVPQFQGLATLIGLIAAAAAFEPLRRRAGRVIDRWLYPERLNFQAALSAARTQLDRVIARDALMSVLTQQVPQQIDAQWAALSLAPAPDVPPHADPAWNGELIVGGRSLGRYWLGPRRSGLEYASDEQAQLRALTQAAALVLAYTTALTELTTLNQELETRVALRTAQMLEQQRTLVTLEERQHLARELHDSVTQTLFSINLSARAIRGLLRRDVDTATRELSQLESDAQQALTEMRALLSQLRNPIASQRDLVKLLIEHCVTVQHHDA
ncbi:MAG: histidine kinase dimerization/phosphoacceptor domain-containing protein, partial [Thermoflexales bacterium]|nr:histidine kinase dimerization/phosphoacceptor domain-containing protein [Thermoflexales bacterium]